MNKTKFYHLSCCWQKDKIDFNRYYATVQDYSNYWEAQIRAEEKKELGGGIPPERLMQLRNECIFDAVRRKYYDDKPSRMRCIFLFDEDLSYQKYAKNIKMHTYENLNLLEVEVVDPHYLLRTDMRFLNRKTQVFNEIVDIAHAYWKGTEDIHINTEVLYEGYYRILKFVELNWDKGKL